MVNKSIDPLVQMVDVVMPLRVGFHMRAVMSFVKAVEGFRSSVRIRKGKMIADGKSVLGLMALGAGWKSSLCIEVVGDDAVMAAERIDQFFLSCSADRKQGF